MKIQAQIRALLFLSVNHPPDDIRVRQPSRVHEALPDSAVSTLPCNNEVVFVEGQH